MIWSVAIEPSIEAIEQTQFLTPEQKRDIFYAAAVENGVFGRTVPVVFRAFPIGQV